MDPTPTTSSARPESIAEAACMSIAIFDEPPILGLQLKLICSSMLRLDAYSFALGPV